MRSNISKHLDYSSSFKIQSMIELNKAGGVKNWQNINQKTTSIKLKKPQQAQQKLRSIEENGEHYHADKD